MTSQSENGALGSVLDLEHALQAAQATAVDAEARLAQARREADAILAAARERAERRMAQRHASLAAAADADARTVSDGAEAAAAELRARAHAVEAAFVEAALAFVLPPAAREAT